MTALRVIIVDDEQLSRDFLLHILNELDDVEVIDQCENGRQAIKKSSEQLPDLLFLDIQMPGMTGIDVVRSLQSDSMPMIIFATAYDQFAVEAFEVHAVDYVLKPFDPERIKLAIERAKQRKKAGESLGNKLELLNAFKGMKKETQGSESFSSALNKLAIKEDGETHLVPFECIDWIDAAGDYMCVHVGNMTHVMRCTMKELEQKLSTPHLARIHRSTLVNMDKVHSISPLPKGDCLLHLDGDIRLKVSRSYRKNIEKLIS